MKRTILSLTSALALLGTTLTLRADVMLNNLSDPGNFQGFGAGISFGTLFTTGPNRAQVNAVTLEHFLYDLANPPQGFQVRLYKAVPQSDGSAPVMTLVADLGNPTVDPAPASMPGLSMFITYSPLAGVTLEAATTYALVVGEALDGTGSGTVGFTEAPDYTTSAGWVLGSDVFGLDLGTTQLWSPYTGHLRFRLEASPALNQSPDLSNAHASVALLWPPDNRMVPFQIEGVTDPDGDSVTITINAIYQDEPVSSQGPDATIGASGNAAVRAARLGKGNGRVYQVFFTASDGKPDGTADGVVQITVPHDAAHPTAVDDGPLKGYYQSTAR